MAFAPAAAIAPFSRPELKTVGLVSAAHSFSHFYMLVLPPVFPLVHEDLGVSYAALGMLLAIYAAVTGLMQVPMGLLVDRIGGRAVLTAGLALNAVAITLVGLLPSYWAMAGAMALAGAGNSVFHPADYAILAARVGRERAGRAFSLHLFAGNVGWMLAPPAVLALTALASWRLALIVLGLTGLAYAGVLALQGASLSDEDERREARRVAARAKAEGEKTGFSLLMTPVLGTLFLFYIVTAMAGSGIQSFSVVAIVDLHDVDLAAANTALTGYFVAAAIGTLVGGWLADKVVRHELATACSFAVSAAFVALLGFGGLPLPAVLGLMCLGGFFLAAVGPLRDVMVRRAAPAGTVGTAFGIVTTGFSIGLASAPLVLGWVMDLGRSALVFWAISGITLMGLLTLAGVRSARANDAIPRREAAEPS